MSFRFSMVASGSSGGGPLTFTFVGSAETEGSTSSIDIGGSISIASGDFAVWCGYQWDGSATSLYDALPTGWSSAAATNVTSGSYAIDLGYKILTGSEGVTAQRGAANLTRRNYVFVWRPSKAITSVTVNDAYVQLTNANPASNTINGSSAGAGPVIQVGFNAAGGATVNPWTNSNFDSTYATSTDAMKVGTRYDAGIPGVDCVHDMADEGAGNGTAGCYFTFT